MIYFLSAQSRVLISTLFFCCIIFSSCKTAPNCSRCNPDKKTDFYISEKKMTTKRTEKEWQKTTLTGTLTKDIETPKENKCVSKTHKKKRVQTENNNKPIL
jgi:hypothetical protein